MTVTIGKSDGFCLGFNINKTEMEIGIIFFIITIFYKDE